eukprot:137535-Rhodomonas_salina.1
MQDWRSEDEDDRERERPYLNWSVGTAGWSWQREAQFRICQAWPRFWWSEWSTPDSTQMRG